MEQDKTILLVLGIIILIVGLSIFWKGYHNIDLGHNVAYRNAETGDYWIDENSEGEIWTGREMFMKGLEQIELSSLLLIASSALIGLSIGLSAPVED